MERRNNMRMICLFALYVLLASGGLVLFKAGTKAPDFHIELMHVSIDFSLKTLLGMKEYGFSLLIWLYIVSKMDLTFAMPLSVALINLLVIVESCWILKERISMMQGMGILIVLLGVMMMTITGKK